MDSFDATGASVQSEAKGEQTKQLSLFLVPAFHRFFMSCLDQAAAEEPNMKRQLWKFQEILSQVPEWNLDKVQREVQKIVGEIQCDQIEELVTAVFIAHTKVLTAIRIGNKNKRVQITIPKLDHFIHRSLSESSRLLWSSAYLFHNELSPIEKQKNHRQIEQLLHEGISQAIRGLLPVKNILKDYLAEPTADEGEDDDEEDEKEEKEEKIAEKFVDATTGIVTPEEAAKISALVNDEKEVVGTESETAPETLPETLPETVPETVPETTVSEPILSETEVSDVIPPIPVSDTILSEPIVSQPPPTFVVETEPSVRFTDYNQVIQQRGGETHINQVATTHETEEEGFTVLDDDAGSISDFEDLTLDAQAAAESLSKDDFETLP